MADRRDTTAAERQRRRRARQAAGMMAVPYVEVPTAAQAWLVERGYLLPAQIGDRAAVAAALSEALEDFFDGRTVTP